MNGDKAIICFACQKNRSVEGISDHQLNAEIYFGELRSRHVKEDWGLFKGEEIITTTTFRVTGPYRYWICQPCVYKERVTRLCVALLLALASGALFAFMILIKDWIKNAGLIALMIPLVVFAIMLLLASLGSVIWA